jgi:uncharacterized protein with HEPN domain
MKNIPKLLRDMFEAIESIEAYQLFSYEAFVDDEKTQDAIMFNLIVLGEAANGIPKSYQESHPELPWAAIIGTRNVIVHGYDQIKLPIVWDILTKDLYQLKQSLEELLSNF